MLQEEGITALLQEGSARAVDVGQNQGVLFLPKQTFEAHAAAHECEGMHAQRNRPHLLLGELEVALAHIDHDGFGGAP